MLVCDNCRQSPTEAAGEVAAVTFNTGEASTSTHDFCTVCVTALLMQDWSTLAARSHQPEPASKPKQRRATRRPASSTPAVNPSADPLTPSPWPQPKAAATTEEAGVPA